MCMVVFAASDEPLSNPSPEKAFLCSAQPLSGASEAVLRLFSKPHIYDLSSIGGCACGFGYGPYDLEIPAEPDVANAEKTKAVAAHEAARESVRLLKEYLRVAVRTGTVEVYSCWNGDEGAEPETRLGVSLAHFGVDEFSFVEKQLLTVH